MKKKLFIFGIAALLLFGGIMGGLAANDKSDVPPKVETTPNANEEQLPPKIPERYAPMRIDIAPNAQEQVPSKTSGQEASVVSNVANTPDRGLPIPVIREAVIVYFKEMPSLEAFASKYDAKLIFAKQDIKLAAFETRPVGEPGKTSQRTLDFIDEVSKDPGVERVFKDEFMFLKPDKAYSLEPKVVFPADMEDKYVANEVTAVFWRLPPSLEDFALKYGVKIKDVEDVLMFAVFETDDITGFLKKVSADPYISSAHPRAIGQYYGYTPNDPKWDLQWGARKIYAPDAWDYQKGSTGITVAVLDTGVDYNHEDLSGRVIKGWNFINNNSDPMDDVNHGTHVSGIIGAIMDNNKGIAGVAQVSILAVKIGDQYQPYPDLTAKGIRYAANNSAKVISMSFGWAYDYDEVRSATEYAWSRGSLLVAASGNEGSGVIRYPANYTDVIAVGATDSSDQRAWFSNYGAKLELVAPGVNINSTIRNNQYENKSGTSMAAPHVSGVAALIWSQNPTFSNQKVREVLRDTAVDLGSAGQDIYYGYGKVNAYAAVTKGKLLSSQSGSLSGTGNSYTYSVAIPAPSIVSVVMAGNENADFDLYARWGSPPTTGSYDAAGYSSTSLEYFQTQGSGTLYIMVNSYNSSGSWKSWVLSGSYSDSGKRFGTVPGTGYEGSFSHNGAGIGYAFNSGPDGSDFDLFTKWNSPPTTTSYDASGTTSWPEEIAGPAAGSGTNNIMIYSYSGGGETAAVGLIY
ncbi:serine protease [Methanosarcinales archaeon]|uniref:S8 family serine peptidase n=1 Tax=Candidatus Methanoperedens sp. BLZ2 TaxID=2035255 RepID=UPI000BE35CDA|nr:S8 family serine peptidase [Candidatus Methanoperedens sp. BLZ2]KAB2943770.1 MAG: S8 family serine peptidase [Candidatus Methanoperedens sp.]MBZ0174677.1 S8 family serine peptidase [Candidatus Methanoperedens nitroreducens]CAG0999421.1 serine protease [Methanosarcinales archaeon]MCX9078373.1 S8 family serine peptidase [Candidatus Methanoperedens sp.]MCX9087248.1 S8 family serine peptidase [Candidatus Methanoperedens sp.]